MNTLAISPINTKDKTINVIIETPARSPYKYAYDSELELFKVKRYCRLDQASLLILALCPIQKLVTVIP